jgi:hypothetical protein
MGLAKRQKTPIVFVTLLGIVLSGCGGGETDPDKLPTLDTPATAEAVKLCLEKKAPDPFEQVEVSADMTLLGGFLSQNRKSGTEIRIFNTEDEAEDFVATYDSLVIDKKLGFGTGGVKIDPRLENVLAPTENIVLRYMKKIPDEDLALLRSCTTEFRD